MHVYSGGTTQSFMLIGAILEKFSVFLISPIGSSGKVNLRKIVRIAQMIECRILRHPEMAFSFL